MPRSHTLTCLVWLAMVACLLPYTSWAEDEPTNKAKIKPPTVSRETTYFLGPLDEDGYVDYFAALNQMAPDYGIANQDNAYVGLLELMDTSDWDADYRAAHYKELGLAIPIEVAENRSSFWDYSEKNGIPIDEANRQFNLAQDQPWSQDDAPVVARWIKFITPHLHDVKRVIDRKGYYSPLTRGQPDAILLDTLLPELKSIRSLARSLHVRSNFAMANDDIELSISDIITIKKLAGHLSKSNSLLPSLVSMNINSMAFYSTKNLLQQKDLTQKDIQKLVNYWQTSTNKISFEKIVTFERAATLDAFTKITTKDDPTNSLGLRKMMDANGDIIIELQSERQTPIDVDRGLNTINTFFDTFYSDIDDRDNHGSLEEYFIRETPSKIEMVFIIGALNNPNATEEQLEYARSRITDNVAHQILAIMAPAYGAGNRTAKKSQITSDLVLIGLAMRLYHLDHDQYPETMEALVPDYIAEIPIDNLNDMPLSYLQRDDGTVVVYSFGDDVEDDHGRHDWLDDDISVELPALD